MTLCNINLFRLNNASHLSPGLQWTVERVDHLDPDPFGGGAGGYWGGRSEGDPRGLHIVSVKQAEHTVTGKDSLAMIKVGSAVRSFVCMFRLLRLLLLVREGQSCDDKGWFTCALICFFVPFVAVVS